MMWKGIIFALGACFIWGLIFVIPLYMEGFSPIEVALGRYLFFGTISAIILLPALMQGACRYPVSIWLKALYFSFASTIGYYTFFMVGLRFSTPAICALVLSTSPITIAFYGNWVQKECSFKSLILPSVLILMGLLIINIPHINTFGATHVIGICCSFWALFAWSWYVVANSRFLVAHPEVASSDWSTLIGVVTLFWVFALGLIVNVFFAEQIQVEKYFELSPMLISFLGGCAVLGLVCSWLGCFLWNQASHYLPVSLAGQLTIFETIFGLCFIYTFEQRFPSSLEGIGIALFLAAVILGIRTSRQGQTEVQQVV